LLRGELPMEEIEWEIRIDTLFFTSIEIWHKSCDEGCYRDIERDNWYCYQCNKFVPRKYIIRQNNLKRLRDKLT